jgi:hypothetical protein
MDDMPKLKNGNYTQLMNAYVKGSLPPGAHQHFDSHRGVWKKSTCAKPERIGFSTHLSECIGGQTDVAALALKIAKEALESGDLSKAQQIMEAVRDLPQEYQRRMAVARHEDRERVLKRLKTRT